MPTVILLDVSLSMSQQIAQQENSDVTLTRLQLAIQGINTFLDNLAIYSKLEFVTLITFSSRYDVLCGFTREYDLIKSKLHSIEECDKTCIETVLHGVNGLVLEEWGSTAATQVILITDGNLGIGPMSLGHSLRTANKRELNQPFPLPFFFPGELHVCLITTPDDPNLPLARSMFQKLVDFAGNNGNVLIPENNLTISISINNMFNKFAEDLYSFKGILKCGHLNSHIVLSPPPLQHTKITDFESKRVMLSKNIEVCGFINVNDMSSPAAISRHLILPIAESSNKENQFDSSLTGIVKSEVDSPSEGEEPNDDGKIPNLCVLLHGALKVENVVALVQLGDDWFGYIYSYADSKKKSNLMLTVLHPGSDIIPWLGDLNNLAVDDIEPGAQAGAFPLKPAEKRSYTQNIVVWIKHAGLQSDIQKILRHARKLPDKTTQFYKELNRLRRAAVSLGFTELLDGLSFIFERECSILPGGTNPDCALQLTHAANELRKPHNRGDLKYNIVPMVTQFNSSNTGKPF